MRVIQLSIGAGGGLVSGGVQGEVQITLRIVSFPLSPVAQSWRV